MDKLSYGLGLGIGQQLLQMNIEGLELDDFFAAIKDVLTGRYIDLSSDLTLKPRQSLVLDYQQDLTD